MPDSGDRKNREKPAKVRLIEINSDGSGQRIDNFLLGQLKGVPRSMIYRLLRTGQVRVNKGRKKPHYKLNAGDRVRIPPVSISEGEPPQASHSAKELLSSSILFEDKSLIILNKPAGMAVHGGSGINYGVIEAFRQLRPECRFLELVHRLDRETSGCLVLAKKRSALVGMHEMLRREHGKSMDKTYLALLRGVWQGKKKKINASLEVNNRQSGERFVTVSSNGKSATSIFVPERSFPEVGACLVSIRLLTGRTHQARVHALSIDQPIAGDERYGDRAFNRRMKLEGLKRLFLHASRLRFRHPIDDKQMDIEAPLPESLARLLDKLS
ncbi:MAG: 23S rRNA pseudouridine(955/2504/2580) synthase RluC [Gammaproteobacteria bacterium]|nr:MAG: 23S rRNA pseudouridine(955/2504/2580) synthase RluC [Gammaproteobacteria bacterium]